METTELSAFWYNWIWLLFFFFLFRKTSLCSPLKFRTKTFRSKPFTTQKYWWRIFRKIIKISRKYIDGKLLTQRLLKRQNNAEESYIYPLNCRLNRNCFRNWCQKWSMNEMNNVHLPHMNHSNYYSNILCALISIQETFFFYLKRYNWYVM